MRTWFRQTESTFRPRHPNQEVKKGLLDSVFR